MLPTISTSCRSQLILCGLATKPVVTGSVFGATSLARTSLALLYGWSILFHARAKTGIQISKSSTATRFSRVNIPDVGSKQHLGTLSNGDGFLVHNPSNNTERYRQPLTIATSRGSDRSYKGIGVLRTNASTVMASDTRWSKRLMFSYPTAIMVEGKLVVSYNENKENIWVSVVDPKNLL